MSNERLENIRRPAERFLRTLKTTGPQTVAELGCAAGVCGEAARQQLQRLAADGLVEATAEAKGVGRPAQVWSLTPEGDARFPDAHAELAANLIESIRTEFGESALNRLIDRRAEDAFKRYASAVSGAPDLEHRIARLAEARTREGYMAEYWAEGDGYVLVENHCPIRAAANACEGFCGSELNTFRRVLGPDVRVERIEHIIRGERRCVYRVAPSP